MKTFWIVNRERMDHTGDIENSKWFAAKIEAVSEALKWQAEITESERRKYVISISGYNTECESIGEWEEWLDEQVSYPDPDEWQEVHEWTLCIPEFAGMLHDAGYRAADRKRIKKEFSLYEDEVKLVCDELASMDLWEELNS